MDVNQISFNHMYQDKFWNETLIPWNFADTWIFIHLLISRPLSSSSYLSTSSRGSINLPGCYLPLKSDVKAMHHLIHPTCGCLSQATKFAGGLASSTSKRSQSHVAEEHQPTSYGLLSPLEIKALSSLTFHMKLQNKCWTMGEDNRHA